MQPAPCSPPVSSAEGRLARIVGVTCISPLQSGRQLSASQLSAHLAPTRSVMREHLLSAISLSLLVHTASLIASPALRTVPHRDQRASAWRVCANAGRGGGSRVGYPGRGQGRGRSNGRGRGRGQSDGRAMRQPPRQARPAPGEEGGGWEPTGATPQTPRAFVDRQGARTAAQRRPLCGQGRRVQRTSPVASASRSRRRRLGSRVRRSILRFAHRQTREAVRCEVE